MVKNILWLFIFFICCSKFRVQATNEDAANCEKIECNFERGTLCEWKNMNTGYDRVWQIHAAEHEGEAIYDGIPLRSTSANPNFLWVYMLSKDFNVIVVDGLSFSTKRYLKMSVYDAKPDQAIVVSLNTLKNEVWQTRDGFVESDKRWRDEEIELPIGTTKIYIGAYRSDDRNAGEAAAIDEITIVDDQGRSVC